LKGDFSLANSKTTKKRFFASNCDWK